MSMIYVEESITSQGFPDVWLTLLSISKNPVVPVSSFMSRYEGALLVCSALCLLGREYKVLPLLQ